jgi:cytochrome c oxidase subunit 2
VNQIELGSFWLPRQSSSFASQYDAHWGLVSWVAAVLFILVVTLTLGFIVVYRRRGNADKVSRVDHHFGLEVFWTVLPTVMLLYLFWVGFRGYVNAAVAPGEAFEISGTGEKWRWTFSYPNGTTTLNELRIPKGKPVKITLNSKDVIHSFFIPEFRVKQDAVPGTYTTVWFEATRAGETMLECTEYCGTGHSDMLAKVFMMEEKDWNDWLEKGSNEGKDLPPADWGKKLYTKSSCETCHSNDGSPRTGPSFKGVFGRSETLSDGSTVQVDENYIRESLMNPQAKVVKGYQPVMPTFKGLLNDKQVDALIAYLKSLK